MLGLKLDEASPKTELKKIPGEIEDLWEQREKARKEKDFAKSDKLRKEIEARGFEIQDSQGKTRLFKKPDF